VLILCFWSTLSLLGKVIVILGMLAWISMSNAARICEERTTSETTRPMRPNPTPKENQCERSLRWRLATFSSVLLKREVWTVMQTG